MKNKNVISYSFGCNLIGRIADILYQDFYKKNKSLERVACVFGGRRPGLFLKKQLWQKIKKSFIPPAIFSMDEFMHYLASGGRPIAKISQLELYYLIYKLSRKNLFAKAAAGTEFSGFLGWAEQVTSFIEQLDLENIENDSLMSVEKSAAIGYEIPKNINGLLKNIIRIRKEYHDFLAREKLYSRSLVYAKAAGAAENNDFSEFDKILFCNLYYLNRSEEKVVSRAHTLGKSICIFEGSASRWPVLKKNSQLLGAPVEPAQKKAAAGSLKLYQGFDTQSQVSLAKEIIKSIGDKDNTVIVLPKPEALVPLLSEAGPDLGHFNISLGYPLNRSSLYNLFDSLAAAHQSKKGDKYYARDYLRLIKHPLIKNMKITGEGPVTRVLVHKIEEALTGVIQSSLAGCLFIGLEAVEADCDIYRQSEKTLASLGCGLTRNDYRRITRKIHGLFFRNWEEIDTLGRFSRQLGVVLDSLAVSAQNLIQHFPFESKAIEAVYKAEEEFASLSFKSDKFSWGQIWNIFKHRLDKARISFLGSPLRGAQILGLFETRALQFKNVIILDTNEGVLPRLKAAEPLIPSEVMMSLGLSRLQKEEEIQRYHFMRLVESAENTFLIWAQNQAREKSRFIEDILWQEQKKQNKTAAGSITKLSFSFSIPRPKPAVEKTEKIVKFLKESTYSASRINTYLECPLRFYYKYVLGLAEKEDLLEGVKDSQIGSFIHQLLCECYSGFLDKKPVFGRRFMNYFETVFSAKYESQVQPRMHADSFLLKEIIHLRLKKFLEEEKKKEADIVKVLALEKPYQGEFDTGAVRLNFKYIVDRIDLCRGDNLSVIDYKTGGRDIVPSQLRSLEKMGGRRQEIRDKVKSFQLPLYYYFTRKMFPGKKVNAYVYNLRTAEQKPFISAKDWLQKEKLLDYCLKALKFIVDEIFSLEVPFEADPDPRRCRHCPFYYFCA